jgi:predicted dehydrogenase
MNIVIVGLGSIAWKHISALRQIDPRVNLLALRSSNPSDNHEGITNIYTWDDVPENVDFTIISNPTKNHAETIISSAKVGKPLFIEKPVLDSLEDAEKINQMIKAEEIVTYTACNLRFHPAIQYLRDEIKMKLPLELNLYCGSFLPDWRPGTDYRENYSANKEMGGGVHLDLVHEIDYCRYLLGDPIYHSSYIRKKSKLEISSPDIAHYALEFENTSAFITLNYYRKDAKREVVCVWDDKTWTVDLLNNSITDIKNGEIYSEAFDIKSTYLNQMKYFISCLENDEVPMNSFGEAIKTLKIAINE